MPFCIVPIRMAQSRNHSPPLQTQYLHNFEETHNQEKNQMLFFCFYFLNTPSIFKAMYRNTPRWDNVTVEQIPLFERLCMDLKVVDKLL